ncbi:MAG: ubiquinone biosynthesis regulatory protein kinase UbiB [Pseudomonadales bacterium]
MFGLRRLIKIIRVTLRYRLDLLFNTSALPWHIRILLLPVRAFPAGSHSRGERIRLALEELGPIFIKFGQMLSTRPDLIPADIVDQLSELQDNVPPFDEALAAATIEAALEQNISTVFKRFDTTPMASASVAQVHAAALQDGSEVVVKVLRPGIEKVIQQDIKLLFSLARLVHRYAPDGRRLRPVEIVDDYQHTIMDELDLLREASNAAQLKRNFADSDMLYVPKVYWDYTRTNVFVMERIYGIAVTDIAALNAGNTNLQVLAERGVEIFFTQVFRDSFFHADMHPGNIFVDIKDPEKPRYIAVDCAIIGSLSDHDQYYLARNLLAIFQREYRQVAQLHIECGWIPETTRVNDFEAAIRSVCEPIFQKPISEISFGQLLVYLFTVARRFDMTVQPSLVLLQKTLLNIEGLGRQLYPQLDLWQTAQPFLERWVEDRYAPAQVMQRLQRQAPSWLEQLPQVPDLLLQSLKQSQHLAELTELQQMQLQQMHSADKKARRRRLLALVALLVGGGFMLLNPTAVEMAAGDLTKTGLLIGGLALAIFLLG